LIDLDLHNELIQYQQLCDYFIAEGVCYEVGFAEDYDNLETFIPGFHD